MTQTPQEFEAVEAELGHLEEWLATLEGASKGCCTTVGRVSKLSDQLGKISISDSKLKARIEAFRTASSSAQAIEQKLRSQLPEVRSTLATIQELGIQRK